MAKDFIPRANALFSEYIKNSVNKVSLNFASYNITQDKILPLNEACDRYTLAEALAANPDTATTGTRRERDEKRKTLEKMWREFVNANIRYNSLVPAADLTALGLKPADTVRTAAGVPVALGMVTVKRLGTLQYELRVLDEATGKAKHPQYATGSYLYLAVTAIDRTPESADVFRKLEYSTSGKHPLTFTREQLGSQAHVFVRYSNAHGKQGPQGQTDTFIIS